MFIFTSPIHLHFKIFLLRIFLNYISNAIPKVPHILPPTSLPTHSHYLALAFSCTGAYTVCMSNGPLFPVINILLVIFVYVYVHECALAGSEAWLYSGIHVEV